MMDPLTISGAVITAINTSATVISILRDAKHAKKERQEWMMHLEDVRDYLEQLQGLLKTPHLDTSTPWYRNFIDIMGIENKLAGVANQSSVQIRPDSTFGRLDSKLGELRIKLEPQPGWRHHQYFRQGLHYFNKAEFATIFAELDRLQSKFERSIQLGQLNLSAATHDETLEVKGVFTSQMHEEERTDALRRLSKLEFADRQNQIYGTCFQDGLSAPSQWFLTSEEFVAWRAGRHWPLYCVGKPGAGKTVLSSIVVRHLEDHCMQQVKSEQYAVIYLYLDYKERQTQTHSNLLRSVLHQLLRGRSFDFLSDEARKFFKFGRRKAPSDEEVLRILRAEVNAPVFERMYLIVDALDEYPEDDRPKLLETCRNISVDKLSLFITSRPSDKEDQPYIQCVRCPADKLRYLALYFSCPACDKFDICQDCKSNGESCGDSSHELLEPETVTKQVLAPDGEIERFARCMLREQLGVSSIKRGIDRAGSGSIVATRLAKLFPSDPKLANELTSEISDAIVRSAEGMYLIAKLHLDSLKVQPSRADIRRALRDLSGQADKIYANIMIRIQDQSEKDKSLAMHVLSWVFCAQRPLKIAELLQALAIRTSCNERMLEDEETDFAIVARVTLGLVFAENNQGAVRLVHRTTHEYLENNWRRLFPGAPTDIALTTLKYLCFDTISSPCDGEREDQQIDSKLQTFPFLAYASVYWGDHVQGVLDNARVKDEALNFLKHSSRRSAAIQTAWYAGSQSQAKVAWSMRAGVDAVHVCAYYGLDSCIVPLLDELPDVQIDSRDGKPEQTPLMYACMKGHLKTVSTILGLGANVNLVNKKGSTAAFLAISNRNPKIVEMMIASKEVNPPLGLNAIDEDQQRRSLLMLAALNGYQPLLTAIVKRPEINVNFKDAKGYTALALAATKNETSIVKILLEYADVNLPNDIGSTPLIIAAEGGKLEMVIEMLKRDANWQLRNHDGHTAFMKAIIHGHTEIVKLLLNHNAKNQIADGSRNTALHIACSAEETKPDMINLLHAQGLQLNAQGDHGDTPLHNACRIGNVDVAEALLALQVDPLIKDSCGRTPLIVAWQNGHTDLIKLLQDHVSSTSESIPEASHLPLWSMAKLGHKQLLQDTLKTADTDLQVRDPDTDSTALHWAIRSGNVNGVEIAEILLNAGASTCAVDDHKRTPLHIAAYKGYYEAATLLLDFDTDLNVRDAWDLTPVTIAQTRKYYALAARLVEAGALVEENSSPQDSQATFCAAVENGFLKAAQSLLDHGIDLEGRDGEGHTVMQLAKTSGSDDMLQWLRGLMYQHE